MAQKKKNTAGFETLKANLKDGSFRKFYILYGEEDYLRDYYFGRLRERLVSGPAESFNYHRLTAESWSLETFAGALDAVPMLAERSLVELVDIDLFSLPERERAQLAELLADLPDYVCLVLRYDTVAWKPDKRMKKLYAPIEASAVQVEFPKQGTERLLPWIRRHAAFYGKHISDDLCRYLIFVTGGTMTALDGELKKLCAYSGREELTRSDIDAVVIPVLDAAVFDITKKLSGRDYDGALQKLRDLMKQEEEPIAVTAVIGRQMRQLYTAKVLNEHGKGADRLMALWGLRDFAARQLMSEARSFSKRQLGEAVRMAAQTDYAMKTSGGDPQALLELLVLQIAQVEAAG